MSVYYTLKEHLIVKNLHERGNDIPVAQMKRQLSLLGALMLTDDAAIASLEVIADGTTYRFSGKEVSPELHALLRGMDQGDSVEIVADYSFRWNAASEHLNAGHLAVCGCVEKLLKEAPEQAENIFYSVYNEADCNIGGVLVAYGKKDGKLYHGIVEPAPAALPEDGVWENAGTTILFADACTDETDVAAIAQIGHTLAERFPNVKFTRDENGVSLYADFLTLRSKVDFELLIEQYARLLRATDGKCSLLGCFADLNGKDAAVVELDIEADSSYTLNIARV